ncbi:MAG: hypothetical protein Ta2D_02290 [Rickettsiales bacterium]|nr:MAG: hypothetical protein Ta2D_02290 [Rickettsiales bacterium]
MSESQIFLQNPPKVELLEEFLNTYNPNVNNIGEHFLLLVNYLQKNSPDKEYADKMRGLLNKHPGIIDRNAPITDYFGSNMCFLANKMLGDKNFANDIIAKFNSLDAEITPKSLFTTKNYYKNISCDLIAAEEISKGKLEYILTLSPSFSNNQDRQHFTEIYNDTLEFARALSITDNRFASFGLKGFNFFIHPPKVVPPRQKQKDAEDDTYYKSSLSHHFKPDKLSADAEKFKEDIFSFFNKGNKDIVFRAEMPVLGKDGMRKMQEFAVNIKVSTRKNEKGNLIGGFDILLCTGDGREPEQIYVHNLKSIFQDTRFTQLSNVKFEKEINEEKQKPQFVPLESNPKSNSQKPVSKTINNETTRQTKTAPVVEVEPQKQDTAPIKPVETKLENNPPLPAPRKKQTPEDIVRDRICISGNGYPHLIWQR